MLLSEIVNEGRGTGEQWPVTGQGREELSFICQHRSKMRYAYKGMAVFWNIENKAVALLSTACGS